MKIPIPKLKAILLYFCENTDNKFLGKVKLMKLFYFLDFLHTKNYATPVTYDRYVKLDHGPIPSVIKNMVDDLELDPNTSDLAEIIDVNKTTGQEIHRIVQKRKLSKAEKKYFSESETNILEEVCRRFGKKNTKDTEKASHDESAWKMSAMYQEIPYTLAANDLDCRVKKEEIELGLKLAGL